MVHAESGQPAALVNQRFAYVAGSRMREGLDLYTDNAEHLTASLDRHFDKTAALDDRGGSRQQHGQQANSPPERTPSTEASHAIGQSGQRGSPRARRGTVGDGTGSRGLYGRRVCYMRMQFSPLRRVASREF
jgi:hypothetical protein